MLDRTLKTLATHVLKECWVCCKSRKLLRDLTVGVGEVLKNTNISGMEAFIECKKDTTT